MKGKKIISGQSSADLRKMNDLVAVAGSTTTVSIFRIDGVEYIYEKGADCIRSGHEFWRLPASNKTAAKKKIFELVR